MHQRLQALLVVATLILASQAGAPGAVRANGFAAQDDTWVATAASGAVANGSTAGSSCSDPGFVTDGTDDDVEIGYAITDVNAEGTVHLCAGEYHLASGLLYDKDFTLTGAGMGSTFVLGSAEFDENGDYASGGSEFLFSATSSTLTVRDLTIRGFYGDSYGALYGTDFVLERVQMDHNGSAGDGGAIWATGSVTVRQSILSWNHADETGGAINGADVTIRRSLLRRNTALQNGGAVYAEGEVRFTHSSFARNRSLGQGGAAFIDTSSLARIRDSVFRRNRSTSHGGAMRIFDSHAQIWRSTFVRNRTSEAGGAFDAYDGRLQVRESTFTGNRAKWNGGGFVSWQQDRLVVRGSSLVGNRARWQGGGFIAEATVLPVKVFGNWFVANHSNQGGGISLSGEIAQHVRNNTFRANSAPHGGAVFVYACLPPRAQAHRFRQRNDYVLNRSTGRHPKVGVGTSPC